MFEQASRRKLHFDSRKGPLAVEDLWDLPLTSATGRVNLDEIAIALHRKMENANISFVNPERMTDPDLQLQFDLVQHIIKVLKTEKRAETKARDRAARNQKIMAIMARKQDTELEGKSLEELEKLLAED